MVILVTVQTSRFKTDKQPFKLERVHVQRT